MTDLDKLSILFHSSRPLGWMIAPTLWYAGVVHSEPSRLDTASGSHFICALTFPLCLITFGLNDIYDSESDRHNIRKRNTWTHGAVLESRHHQFVQRAAVIATVIVILLALPASINSPAVLACAGALLSLVWAYSTPPIRLKERPLLDAISNGAICWLLWASGYVFTGRKSLLRHIEPSAYHGRLAFLLAVALHCLAAVEDIEADSAAGQRTIATTFGTHYTLTCSLIAFIAAMLVVDLQSLVGMVPIAGAATVLISILVPRTRPLLTRLAFAGSYFGSIIWIVLVLIWPEAGFGQQGNW